MLGDAGKAPSKKTWICLLTLPPTLCKTASALQALSMHNFQWLLKKKLNLFIYSWLCRGSFFLAVHRLSSCGEQGLRFSCGVWTSNCGGFSCCAAQAVGMGASVLWYSGLVLWVLSCPLARGIFPNQRSNQCPLHWQMDPEPLDPQGTPWSWLLTQPSELESRADRSRHGEFLECHLPRWFWAAVSLSLVGAQAVSRIGPDMLPASSDFYSRTSRKPTFRGCFGSLPYHSQTPCHKSGCRLVAQEG